MHRTILAVAVICMASGASALAQEFPSRPGSRRMPYAAGGPGATITRVTANGMGKVLGRQFVVENTAGAGGTIGTAKVAASPPDGYSLLVMHFGHAANTALYRNLRYDAVTDFEPVGLIAESPIAVVARKDYPADNLRDFVAKLKAGRDTTTAGHPGIGSPAHPCHRRFFTASRTPLPGRP